MVDKKLASWVGCSAFRGCGTVGDMLQSCPPMKKISLVFGILLTAACSVWAAAPQFDRVFGSHMVLPYGKPVSVSGTADPGKSVVVSFGNNKVKGKTDAQGRWMVSLPAMKPDSTGKVLAVEQGKEKTELEDILVGVVWVASGQSNMAWRMNQTPSGKDEIPSSANPMLRLMHNEPLAGTSGRKYGEHEFSVLTPEGFFKGEWKVASPESVAPCSAVGYYFARDLQKSLGMPVGLIHSSLGGSEMAAWLPSEIIEKRREYASCRGNEWLESPFISAWVRGRAKLNISDRLEKGETPEHPFKPAFLYESGIEWLTGLPVHGILWYQGESDAEINDSRQNRKLLMDLIQSWRAGWKNPELPFVMIQLPRINDHSPLRIHWPEFREVQSDVAGELKNVEFVNTIDLGSADSNVHPPEKIEVGKRAANVALNRFYGRKGQAFGPELKDWKIKGGHVFLQFKYSEGLVTTDGQTPKCFELAGDDGVFYSAEAVMNCGNGGVMVILSSPDVRKPVSARYCWDSFVEPNLVNGAGLPAVPFRTDGDEEE